MESAVVERLIKMRRESERKASTASKIQHMLYGRVYQHVSLSPSPCLPTAQLSIEAKVRISAE